MDHEIVELWLVRHGETTYNAARRIAGWCDPPLTDLGRQQAMAVGPKLDGTKFDSVWSSNLQRAVETSRLAWGDATPDERLRECNFGAWEGRPFDEVDAAAGAAKVQAAARRLGRINGQVRLEAVSARFGPDNALELAGGMDVIVDGTDNFASRFVINDLAVQEGIPWVFAGVVGAEGQTMTVVPGRTPCLRCVFESPPPPCLDPSCRSAGVLGPAVAALAALEAMEALKILSGRPDSASRWLRKFDFWSGGFQQIDLAEACERSDCPCCKRRQFDFLHP